MIGMSVLRYQVEIVNQKNSKVDGVIWESKISELLTTNENAHFTDGTDVMEQVYTPKALRKQQRKWLPQLFMSSNSLTFLLGFGYSTVSNWSFSRE